MGRLPLDRTVTADEYTSIHAPHAWGDYLRKNIDFDRAATSIHAPHAWGDLLGGFMGKNYTDFNPRPTCVGRLGTFMATPMTANFNPRPTCVGRRKLSSRERVVKILQSTPHMRGATTIVATRTPTSQTSIHAPHAWGDLKLSK